MIAINSQEIRYFYRNIVKTGNVYRVKYNNKDYGVIKAELDADTAPITVSNFANFTVLSNLIISFLCSFVNLFLFKVFNNSSFFSF